MWPRHSYYYNSMENMLLGKERKKIQQPKAGVHEHVRDVRINHTRDVFPYSHGNKNINIHSLFCNIIKGFVFI